MNRSISLNGTWETAFCEVNSGTLEKITQMPVIPYAVPGDIHTALMEAGLIEEPLEGMNDFACRWVEDKEFWCRRAFDWMFTANRRVFLTFEGLDCTADIYLNGQFIGRQNNAFVEAEYEVTPFLRPGRNELLVRIDPGLAEAQKHPLEQMGLMWNNEQPYRVWMRKPQFVYGWDWTIWLCSCGIWKNVYLTECSEARLTDLYAAPLPEPLKENEPCEVSVFFETDKWAESGCSAEISLRDRENSRIAHAETAIAGGGQILRLVVPQAHLWWCNGFGEPYLYTVTVELKNEAGLILDEKTQRLGLRSVQLAEPDLGNGETGFTFVLNGQPVFCKGANHVPCDCLPGRILPEKERQLVTLARDAHMNMLRIWGGGVYASEPLMNACDEMGVLVWHDFMYACGYYPDHNPAFVENITEEARKAIRRLRRHASLVGWAGNNEIQEMYASQRQTHPDLPWYGGSIYERILPVLVEEMCPGMIYRASSPLGGNKQADARHGDQHIWLLTHVDSHPHYLDLWHFTDFPVKFLSEFGVMGAMTLETAQSCIPPEHLFPDDPVWLHHTNSCQDHTLLKRLVERYFGPCGEMSAGQFILRSQALQAEITRHMYEEFRRQKFTCSGLLFWTLSDSYGVHNWSLIDYGLRRKPIYHALKAAMAPLALCVQGYDVQTEEGKAHYAAYWADHPEPLKIWGMNDTLNPQQATLSWAMIQTDGIKLAEGSKDCLLPANASALLEQVDAADVAFVPEQTVLRVRWIKEKHILNETKYFFAPFHCMIPQDAKTDVRISRIKAGQYAVTLLSDRFIWKAHLAEPDGDQYDENDFDLWPGEAKTITAVTDREDFVPYLTWIGKEEDA